MPAPQHHRSTFRPAPFAVFPADRRSGPLAWLRTTLLIIGTALCLLPVAAGPSSELSLPVYYARIELADRAPVVLELDLPAADYAVQPASLGYFTYSGDFVFSAEVTRGLIYGFQGAELMVVEIVAPARGGMFTDDQLARIRQRVAALNEQENLLRLARSDAPDAKGQIGRLADEFWRQLGPELAGTVTEEWRQTVLAEHAGDLNTLDAILIQQARHRSRLKRLYYDGQTARLDLRLSKFDLQIALARLPKPEMEGLISLGDESLVRRTMLDEINRLETTWTARQAILDHQIANNIQWLSTAAPAAPDLPGSPVDTLFSPPESAGLASRFSGDPPVDATGLRLYEITAQAQLVVSYAESELTAQCLARLDEAARHVRKGGLPAWTDLPHYAPQLKRLRMAGLEELYAFAAAEHAARSPQTAAPLLLALARTFEASGEPGSLDRRLAAGSPEALAQDIQADAVAYGLLVVDRCRRGPGPTTSGTPAQATERSLIDELTAIIDYPAEYDSAAFNLGYLQFMLWYAGLERDQSERIFATDANLAGDETAPADAGEFPVGSDADQVIN